MIKKFPHSYINTRYLATCSADKTVKLYQMDQEKGFVHNRTIYGKNIKKKKIILFKKKDIPDGFGTVLSVVTQNF